MTLNIVILAAGQGKRMHSNLPKVLHRIGHQTLLEKITHTASQLSVLPPIIVYGHQGEEIKKQLSHLNVTWVHQKEQLGTGHALQQALPYLNTDHPVLVLYGDVPLISLNTLKHFISSTPKDSLGILTAMVDNPTGLGRIIRNGHHITQIIEEKDATPAELKIKEINTGIYLIPTYQLYQWLKNLDNANQQREYYLTQIVSFAIADNTPIHSMEPTYLEEILGVNTKSQLAQLERFFQKRQAEHFMNLGVTFIDPSRFDLRGDATIGKDTTIDINVILEGTVKIGNECMIGPNVSLKNTVIGDRVEIKANTVVDGAIIADEAIIGPFARIRPGSELDVKTHVGNFVEIKNSRIGQGSKMNHLSYIGDSEIGEKVNIGAGTITCNYDGVSKHKTIIGSYAFIGSNTELVAPLTIGEGATIGAGSTITKDAPANQLTLSRSPQRSIQSWERPKKEET